MGGDMKESLLDLAGDEAGSSLEKKIWSEIKKVLIVAGPAILTPFSTFGVHVVSQSFMGHLGSTHLAAYVLVFTVLFGFVLGIQVLSPSRFSLWQNEDLFLVTNMQLGMVGGVGTLCGQAYGTKQYEKLGVYLQQSCIILLVVCVLVTPLFVFAAPVLKALGQDHNIADMAGYVAPWFIAVVFLYGAMYGCNAYLQSQSKNFVLSCYAIVSLLVHVLLSWLLVVKLEFGVSGVMSSTCLAFLIMNLGQLLYMVSGGCKETWRGFTALAFRDLGATVKLVVSSGVMICLEFCYNLILILLTGKMENAEVAIDALSICLIITGWTTVVSGGFLSAASVRVSNELGRKDARAAKFSIVTTLVMSVSIGLTLMFVFLMFKENVAYLFTRSEQVTEAFARLSPLVAVFVLLNSVQPVLTGVASGAAQQGIVAYVNLGSYCLVGVPLGVLLGYVFNLQVEGVWSGMIIGIGVQTTILAFMICTTDWDKQVILAQKRINPRFVGDETTHYSSNNDSVTAA